MGRWKRMRHRLSPPQIRVLKLQNRLIQREREKERCSLQPTRTINSAVPKTDRMQIVGIIIPGSSPIRRASPSSPDRKHWNIGSATADITQSVWRLHWHSKLSGTKQRRH